MFKEMHLKKKESLSKNPRNIFLLYLNNQLVFNHYKISVSQNPDSFSLLLTIDEFLTGSIKLFM